MDFKDAIDVIVNQVREIASKMISNADYDKTYIGIIQSKTAQKNHYLYDVIINGSSISIKSKLNYSINKSVMVLIPRNNWENARFLEIENSSSSSSVDLSNYYTKTEIDSILSNYSDTLFNLIGNGQ